MDNPDNYNYNNHTDPDNNNDNNNNNDTNNNPSYYNNINNNNFYSYHFTHHSCTDHNNRIPTSNSGTVTSIALATPTGAKTSDDGGLPKPAVIGIGITAAVIVGFVITVITYKTRHRRHKALKQDDLFDHLPIESPKPPPPPMSNIHHLAGHHHETDNLYNNSDYHQTNHHQGHHDHDYDHHGDHHNYDHHHYDHHHYDHHHYDGDQGTSQQHHPGDMNQQAPSGNQGFSGGDGGQGGNQGFSGGNQGFGGNQGGGLDQLGSTQGPTHTGFNGGHGHHGFDGNSGPSGQGQGQGFGNGPSGSGSQGFGNGPSGAQPQGFTPTNQPFGPGPSQPTGNVGGTGIGGGMSNIGVNLGHVVSTMPPPPPTPVLDLKKPPLAPRPDSAILTSPTFTAPSGLDYRTSMSSVASSGVLQPWEESYNTINMIGYSPPSRQNLLQQVQVANYSQDVNYVRPPPPHPPRVMVSPTIATIPPPVNAKPVVRAPQDRTSSEAVGAITTSGNVSSLNTFDRRHPQLQGDGYHESIF